MAFMKRREINRNDIKHNGFCNLTIFIILSKKKYLHSVAVATDLEGILENIS